ncbi:tRNA lysidine(34) synthetase TilS [Sphingomonas jaspsi]|uniref:tRNA lysidine(34) synthetase TilS n=1 Tax=Sphingomonas jaspsi TaxID=392409 RepID=UPI0004B09E59|nr:tRNA lysidine(34) synthetase TilS [Sphingomonas jaspsi]
MTPDPQAVRRFGHDLDALIAPGTRIGLAVSGGPDSLALLLLSAAARPGLVEASTVDHGLREAAADEAAMVAALCSRLNVPHRALEAQWDEVPTANVQARARAERYRLLAAWADERALPAVATAHHADDQAETLLMRLGRGAGLSGLAGVRADMRRDDGLRLVRPLLGWRKRELVALCEAAGVEPVDDPSNCDPRHDRARVRQWMTGADLDVDRLATSAEALSDAEQALQWAMEKLIAERMVIDGDAVTIDPAGLPRDMVRRLLVAAFRRLGASEPRGAELMRAIAALDEGRNASLSGLLVRAGTPWRVSSEPPRRA